MRRGSCEFTVELLPGAATPCHEAVRLHLRLARSLDAGANEQHFELCHRSAGLSATEPPAIATPPTFTPTAGTAATVLRAALPAASVGRQSDVLRDGGGLARAQPQPGVPDARADRGGLRRDGVGRLDGYGRRPLRVGVVPEPLAASVGRSVVGAALTAPCAAGKSGQR